ncbi:MAG: amidohydrolase family protein [Clostridiaceae bacterium]|jgi:5-methylthioadenosine/S-adenosylhomocysteine deaminase|nr:amidohydrolase family protein [Clostridiaceae bacterium]
MSRAKLTRLIIKNARLLLPDFTLSGLHTVVVSGGHVSDIFAAENASTLTKDEKINSADLLDLKGNLLIPGFTDRHTHVAQQMLHGRTSEQYPMVWRRILVPFESALTPEDMRVSASLAIAEMLSAGITHFADAGGPHMDQVASVVESSGIRATLSMSAMDISDGFNKKLSHKTDELLDLQDHFFATFDGAADGRIKVYFALRQLMNCSQELVRQTGLLAKERKTGVHMHLCEHREEVRYCLEHYQERPVPFLQKQGVLNEYLLAAHGVLLTAEDIRMLAEAKTTVVHCPTSNLHSHGIPNVVAELEHGVRLGLGCDGASSTMHDLFNQARILQSVIMVDQGLPVFDPFALRADVLLHLFGRSSDDILEQGRPDKSIQSGDTADLIVIDLSSTRFWPSDRMAHHLVTSATGQDVIHAIVDGRVVMKNREVLFIDVEKTKHEAEQRLPAILARAEYA